MNKIISIIMTVMTFLGGWFGFADNISLNPGKIAFESNNIAEAAEVSVSKNPSFKCWLTDKSSLTYWMTGKNNGEYIELDFKKDETFNSVVLRENTDNIKKFDIYAYKDGQWSLIYSQDRIMTYRLCTFDSVTASKIKVVFTEINNSVSIGGIEVYNEDRTNSKLRSSAYLIFNEYLEDLMNREDFSDYFDVITDIIVFSNVRLDLNGNVIIDEGEEKFTERMEKLHDIIGDRDVTVWCSVLFQFNTDDPKYSDVNDYRAEFLTAKHDAIMTNIKAFAEKYGIDGIDYDWEHPTTAKQFKTYDKLILDTAEFAKVSIANVTWAFKFSDEAINAVDHFNLMTYDLFDARGDHSDIYECGREAIEDMIGFGVPKEKIFLGIPFYARPENGDARWPTYNEYPELGKNGNYIPDYTYTIDNVTTTTGIYFNSFTEVRDKAALSIQYGIGGVMIFNINSDLPYDNENSLTRAIYEAQNNK